jgi:hypothetical protein
MDMTRTAAEMLEPIPANRLFGVRVRRAGPDGAEVSAANPGQLTGVVPLGTRAGAFTWTLRRRDA